MMRDDQPRPVWLTREQRNDLARLVNDYLGHALSETPLAVVDAWDAAPADPAEAVADEIREIWDTHNFVEASREDAAKILRALGCPAARTPETPPADA